MSTQTAVLQRSNLATSSTPALSAAQQRTRLYKDFLTPALHSRFSRAAVFVLAACHIESVLMSQTSVFWFWNPFSITALRTLLLFMPCLAVFIIRVSNMHVGKESTASSFETIYQSMPLFGSNGLSYLTTLGWYTFSAFMFGEIYIWSKSESANLGWVDPGQVYERPRLNENPVLLRFLWFCFAIAQAGVHTARGEDRVPISEDRQAKQASHVPQPHSRVPESLLELYEKRLVLLGRIGRLMLPVVSCTLFAYMLLIRSLVWPYYHAVGRTLFRDLPYESQPSGFVNGMQLIWQSLSSSFMLVLLWELSSAMFTIFVARPPLKREQPLTNEVKDAQGNLLSKSTDPNGSIISGLKSKKDMPKAFAFWELWLICSQYPLRRKTIYSEVDRLGGSTWAQISTCCLGEISGMQARIRDAQAPQQQQQQQQQGAAPQSFPQNLGLPKILDQSVRDGNVLANQRRSWVQSVGAAAKSYGQSPNANNPVMPRAKRAIEWSTDRVLSKEEQQRLSKDTITKEANNTLVSILRSPPGEVFRQTFARRVCAVALGKPYSNRSNIIHASMILSLLCTCSLAEDDLGQVAKSIASIIRTYTSTIATVNRYIASLQPSWTDVFFTEQDRTVKEVEEVMNVFKADLESILLAFSEYAGAIGVTKMELREAREAVGKGREMRQR